ncbi:hypothetical protein [Candidatus Protofrankia californiensis]|uniref:hypothetical protein n=1 Tax=Candidatus Protofrankia californiensis TaxID=1839754 RepID=UPI001041A1FC|nr:hypothetical protein [Candidatus Protofrankia californiensis]
MAVVLGFPLVLMIGMLAMQRVERMIERVRRPVLRAVPDLDDTSAGEVEDASPPPTRLLRLIVSRHATRP